MQESLEIAEAWDQIPVPEFASTWAHRNVPLARRKLKDIGDKIAATLGASGNLQVQPPADLYFPGYEFMTPAAAGLALVSHEPPDVPAGEKG